MAEAGDEVAEVVAQALTGRGAHVLSRHCFEGLDATLAGEVPEGFPHSVFRILNHLVFWQQYCLEWLQGHQPQTPKRAADSWPGPTAPEDDAAWTRSVEAFVEGLSRLEQRAAAGELDESRGEKTALEILQLIASHNSYHLGQVATLRQMLGSWPPPSGGATW